MANVDFQLLRDWYNSNYYTGVPHHQLGWNQPAENARKKTFTRDYVSSRPLEIDPRVKYRVANLDAIKEFDTSGTISGTSAFGSIEGVPSVYFSQGQPLHQYAQGQLRGSGSATSSSNPYLIATIGDNWGPSQNFTDVKPHHIDSSGLETFLDDRGMTEDVQGAVLEAKSQFEYLKRDLSKLKTPEDIQRWLDVAQETQENLFQHGDTIIQHIHGSDPSKREYWKSQFGDFLTTFGLEDADKIHTKANAFLPDSIDDLELYLDGLDPDNLSREEKSDLRVQITKTLGGIQGIEDTFRINPKTLTRFGVSPNGTFSNGKQMFLIPDWVRAEELGTGLESSDTDLLKRIAGGTATPQEIEKVYGLGALENWRGGGHASGFYSGKYMRAKDITPAMGYGEGAMSSEVLPRTVINDTKGNPTWSVTSPEIGVGGYRPFAIWQYTKNGLRLINEGNNSPVVGGVKPIPTGFVEQDLIRPLKGRGFAGTKNSGFQDFFASPSAGWKDEYYNKFLKQQKLGNMSVGDAVKKFEKLGWKRGFADTSMLTKPLEPFVNVAKGIAEKDEFLEIMQKGFSSPKTAANFANNYAQNPALRGMVNAEMGSSALKFAGKAVTAAAVGFTPFDALNRRDRNFTDFYQTTGRDPTYEENMVLRIKSGLEPALSFASFGAYDALAETPTYKAYLDQEQRDRAPAMERQQSIDYPVISGYQTERTTK